MKYSLISIILPTYNVEKYIAKALQSCINQTLKDIEIIIVDDCSKDKSISIAKEYAKKDSRIKIIHNSENLKLLRARYEGVKIAKSTYIMFLDPDDYLDENACYESFKLVKKNQDVDVVFFNAIVENENTFCYKFNFNEGVYKNKDFIKKLILCKCLYWSSWGKLIKKDLFLQAFDSLNLPKDFKINMAEDVLIYYPLINKAKKVAYLNKTLYHYRINEYSISNDKTLLQKNIAEQYRVLFYLKQNYLQNEHSGILYTLMQYLLLTEIYKKQKKGIKRSLTKLKIKFLILLFKIKKLFFM